MYDQNTVLKTCIDCIQQYTGMTLQMFSVNQTYPSLTEVEACLQG